MNVLTLMVPYRGRSPPRDAENLDGRSASDVPPGRSGKRRDGDRRSGIRPPRFLPGFVPGGWKRNVVVGLGYLLGALAFLGVLRFVIELF
ncbi:hypothetical protein [Haloglomus litoreum]|uniref:hypothetical protein n=1 Tax=Haloglomus litoreum TaxID=3034026 RepID=UPI0023E824F6|nr:hypothetical protein [Haloglomus sp. DT116]